jgi:dTDP-L-rhamnose 4-epimerase
MYEISHYTEVNNVGTAVLLEALAERSVKRLVVASSMSIYGEGLYCAPDGGHRGEVDRTVEQLRAAQWDPRESDGSILTPVPTPETKQPALASIYALSKYDQERMCMIIGRAYGLPSVALRLFNVYGPRQALSNPYTGALAIFASRILNGNSPLIYEDGYQLRDFVSVYDVARAFVLALENPGAPGEVFNIGSGQSYTINDLAQEVANVLGKPDIEPEITGKYRVGDIRHCFADVSRAREILGFTPQVSLEEGLADLGGWLEGQVAHDRIAEARAELAARRLTV